MWSLCMKIFLLCVGVFDDFTIHFDAWSVLGLFGHRVLYFIVLYPL